MKTVGSRTIHAGNSPLSRRFAAGDEFCTFFFADVDVAEVGLKLAFVNGRSHLDGLVEAVADLIFLARANELVDELAGRRLSAR